MIARLWLVIKLLHSEGQVMQKLLMPKTKNVLQHILYREPATNLTLYKNPWVLPTIFAYEFDPLNLRGWPNNLTQKIDRQIWPTKMTQDFVRRVLPTMMTYKNDPEELPARITRKNDLQDPRKLVHSRI